MGANILRIIRGILCLAALISTQQISQASGLTEGFRMHMETTGSLKFYLSAQGNSAYEQTLEQYTLSNISFFWPSKFIGFGGFYMKNFLSRQRDESFGGKVELALANLFFSAGVGSLKSVYTNFSIDTRSGYMLILQAGLKMYFSSYAYFVGTVTYLSKSYYKENNENLVIKIFKDAAMPYLGFGVIFPPQK